MTEDEFKRYMAAHRVCPKCAALHISIIGHYDRQKTAAMKLHPQDYRNDDRARCSSCAWQGTIHDLVPG